MRILLFGKDGQVGWDLCRSLAAIGEVTAIGRQDFDLREYDAVRALIRDTQPDLIVNAAAYTAVDRAEHEPELAHEINAVAPQVLAYEAERIKAGFIHYSTDYVFDGMAHEPYREDDPTAPLNVYGASKLAGERDIARSGGAYFIFRTSWLYSARGKNFFLTVLRLAAEKGEMKIVNDQIGAPTLSREIAEATAKIVGRCFPASSPRAAGYAEMYQRRGIYNMTAGGSTSWFGFASAICASLAPQAKVLPISSAEYTTPAKRPSYSVLSGEKLKAQFGISLPSWDESLRQMIEERQADGRQP